MPRRFFLKLLTALPSLSLVRAAPVERGTYTDSDGNGSPRLQRTLTDQSTRTGITYGA